MIFMAHQLGHKVSIISDVVVTLRLLSLTGVGTCLMLMVIRGY